MSEIEGGQITRLLPILLAAGVTLGGCAALDNDASTAPTVGGTKTTVATPRTTATAPPPTPLPTATEVPPIGDVSLELKSRGDVGEIIVDGTGRTLYVFSRDQQNTPTCYDACALTWQPLLAKGSPVSGHGLDAAAGKTVERRGGGKQVTYRGQPLYTYAGDPDDRSANGQGLDLFGGQWHVLASDGRPLA